MNKKEPLLSIAIATRNREQYCIKTIQHILSFNSNFELVIQDNSESLKIKKFVDSILDTRIQYYYEKKHLNEVDNMDLLIKRVTGKYVIMLGDDDTILPNIFSIVKWADKKNYSAVSPRTVVTYIWPNALYNGSQGRAIIPKSSKHILYNNGTIQLKKLLNNGIINYNSFCLPKLYHGIIKRDILNKVHAITGCYCGGVSPDIYTAVSTALLCEEYPVIDIPISVAGACYESATAERMRGGHRGKLSEAPQLYDKPKYQWNALIPKIYTVETIWGETALHAISDMNQTNLYKYYSSSHFIGGLIGNNIPIVGNVIYSIKRENINENYFIFFIKLLSFSLYKGIHRIIRKVKKRSYNFIEPINSFEELIEYYKSCYADKF